MADPQSQTGKQPKSTGEVVSELWELIKDYGRQETIDPLKNLGRFLGWGAAGAVCCAFAGTFLAIAVLRIFQVEGSSWSNGNWSLVAYVVALILTGAALFVSIKQIKKGKTP